MARFWVLIVVAIVMLFPETAAGEESSHTLDIHGHRLSLPADDPPMPAALACIVPRTAGRAGASASAAPLHRR
jgi:hypothetical protein